MKKPGARMGYTPTRYASAVVARGHGELKHWPGPGAGDIPFGDPSAIPGGIPVLEHLVDLCERGIIHFAAADAEHINLARRNPLAVLPGKPVKPRKFQQWGRFPRNDLGRARARPVTNPFGLPLKKRWLVGAITPKLILDEADEEWEDEVLSEIEEWEDVDALPESDPIEEWSEVEGETVDDDDEISEFEM